MKKIAIAVIVLGSIGIALNMIFGYNTFSFLVPINVGNNIHLYKIDIQHYIDNLKNSFGTITQLNLAIPTRTWQTGEWGALENNLALMLDWFLFAINVLIYPFRVGGYTTLQLLAIIGINTIEVDAAGGLNWLVIVTKFLRDLSIPYI